MLSEHHDIINEFPEHHATIRRLRSSDPAFDEMVARHDAIDDEIRQLEELQSPVSDQEIERLKFSRAALKDRISSRLATAPIGG